MTEVAKMLLQLHGRCRQGVSVQLGLVKLSRFDLFPPVCGWKIEPCLILSPVLNRGDEATRKTNSELFQIQ